jgi:hypothetical protein
MNVPFDYSIDERTLTTIKHLMQKQLNLLKDGEKIKLSAFLFDGAFDKGLEGQSKRYTRCKAES